MTYDEATHTDYAGPTEEDWAWYLEATYVDPTEESWDEHL